MPEVDVNPVERLQEVRQEFDRALAEAYGNKEKLEEVRIRFLGKRSGLINDLTAKLRELPTELRPSYGKELNFLKAHMKCTLEEALKKASEARPAEWIDVTLPGRRPTRGAEHPVHLVRRRIEEIFLRMGYSVEDGPEVEDDWHNFEALNMPPEHPARDDQDTFYLPGGLLLRTHTSPVQIRVMEKKKPPIRIIVPGKVYRRDSDPRHSPMFHQVEGLVVDKGITFAHLKGTLERFLKELFPGKVKVRFRPSYFPFTEPSAEVDVSCVFCKGLGCNVCSGSGWIEILGSGMVDPRVFNAVGIDPKTYTGFAFGLGLDRVAMLLWRIPDLRLLFQGDVRFARQFR